MSLLEDALGFVHNESQRTGYVIDGPFHIFDKSGKKNNDGRWPITDTAYSVLWDDTGSEGDVMQSEIEWISKYKRHITDGVRPCHCRTAEIGSVVIHKAEYEQN